MLPFRFTDIYEDKNVGIYFTNACTGCALKSRCTTGKERRVRRWRRFNTILLRTGGKLTSESWYEDHPPHTS